jgi:hypothetical protein
VVDLDQFIGMARMGYGDEFFCFIARVLRTMKDFGWLVV